MHVVLIEPEIPQNTGNISRTCAVTNTSLHLVGKLGFSIDDRQLKRAGLDYWELLDVHRHETFDELVEKFPDSRFYMATTKAQKAYTDVTYRENDFIVFGKETAGIPKDLLARFAETNIRIPMRDNPLARSLNLSNSVAIVLYEALRQLNFPNLQ